MLVSIEQLGVTGIEVGPTFRPLPQAKLGLAFTWLDTEIEDFGEAAINPFDRAAGPQDLAGNSLPSAPELKATRSRNILGRSAPPR